MNKKGFTLVELLATIVVLSIVVGITIVSVFSSLDKAKMKAEKEYLTQLSNSVDAYMNLCTTNAQKNTSTNCKKYNNFKNNAVKYISNCKDINNNSECDNILEKYLKLYNTITKSGNRNIHVYESIDTISFSEIVSESILVENDLINPVNNKDCSKDATITFYLDEDYVSYYKIKLPENCIKYSKTIKEEYPNCNIITTLLRENDYCITENSLPPAQSSRTSGSSSTNQTGRSSNQNSRQSSNDSNHRN